VRARVQIRRLRPGAIIPRYMTEHAAGMDLCAAIAEPIVIEPGARLGVPTGLAVAIAPGFEGDKAEYTGATQVLAKYPDIRIVAEVYGKWDDSVSQAEIMKVLPALAPP